MTAEIVAGYTTGSYSASGTSRVINTPGHAQGDVIYITYVSDGDSDTASISGFAAKYDNVAIGTTGVFCLFYKTAGASEPASYTIENTVSERANAVAFAVRGGAGVDATGSNQTGSSATATVPAVVTTVNNCLRISIVAGRSGAAPFGTASTHTKLTDLDVTSGGAQTVQWKVVSSSGSDASQTISLTASGNWVGVAFAIAPGEAPPTTMEYEAVLLALKLNTGAGTYTITTDAETPHGFMTGDLIRAQKFNGNNVYQSDLQVLSVTSTTVFVAALIGGSSPPEVGWEYVRIGNTSNTERQGGVYISTNAGPFIDIFDGVSAHNQWNTAGKIKGRYGLLTGITSQANEYGIIAGDGDFTTTGAWFKASNLGVQLNNVDIEIHAGGAKRFELTQTAGMNFYTSANPGDQLQAIGWYTAGITNPTSYILSHHVSDVGYMDIVSGTKGGAGATADYAVIRLYHGETEFVCSVDPATESPGGVSMLSLNAHEGHAGLFFGNSAGDSSLVLEARSGYVLVEDYFKIEARGTSGGLTGGAGRLVKKSAIVGSQVYLANDGMFYADHGILWMIVAAGSAGTLIRSVDGLTTPAFPNNNELIIGGGSELKIRLDNGGNLSIWRNAGTETWDVIAWLVYL